MRKLGYGVVLLLTLFVLPSSRPLFAQDSSPTPLPENSSWSGDQLDQMLGPIALYPDPLIAVLLPAATQPAQIVAADHYLQNNGDPNQVAAQGWDANVQALTHYPTVLQWMDNNIEWTSELGQAFASQQTDVMNAIQQMRAKAQALGNLQSTPQENVTSDDGDIDIDPADPNDIYVPDYPADTIYYQPGVYCGFGVGFPIGFWLANDWDWHHHHLVTWGPGHPRPNGWWGRSPAARRGDFRQATVFKARARPSIIMGGGGGGGDRGYSYSRSYAAPHTPAPVNHSSPHSGPARTTEAPRISEPARAPVRAAAPERMAEPSRAPALERSEPSESAFGGNQSAREVRESSSRGASSRGVSVGGGGGGGGSHGGNRR